MTIPPRDDWPKSVCVRMDNLARVRAERGEQCENCKTALAKGSPCFTEANTDVFCSQRCALLHGLAIARGSK